MKRWLRAVLWSVCIVAVLTAVAGAWLVAASRLFVLIGGLARDFPEPYSEWWVDACQPDLDRWTRLYLAVSALVAGVPALVVLVLGGWLTANRYRTKRPPLYGETGWADPSDMRRGGITADRLPF